MSKDQLDSLHETHARATLVEQQLRHRFGPQTMVSVHVEPEKVATP